MFYDAPMFIAETFPEFSSEPDESNSQSHAIIAFLDIIHRPAFT
jgi:hypothetical protein